MPVEEFRTLVDERGAAARPLGWLIELLSRDEGVPFDALVRATALPRRMVEEALAALGDDVEPFEGAAPVRLRREAAPVYAGVVPGPPAGVAGPPPAGSQVPEGLVDALAAAIAAAPRARHELDHVAATAETVARRAAWLASTFALAGRRVLFLGDHDLTSLGLAAVEPRAEMAVADLDEDVLAHIGGSPLGGGRIACAWTDVRLGLPRRLRGWADVVVTDPPYTPEGIGLFARRGLEGLADHGSGRLVVAYGYGDRPGLGLKVQDALADLRLAYEAILPGFNRYVGAQAIGSASNLYVLRPTAATRRALAKAPTGDANVYTHGSQSLEGGDAPLTPEEAAAVVAVARGDDAVVQGAGAEAPLPVGLAVGAGWPDGTAPGGRVSLTACLAPTTPESSPARGRDDAAVVDLRHDPGSLLLRVLLGVQARRVAVLVPNDHPDLADAAGQEALRALVAPRLSLHYRRSTPGPKLAIVEATVVPVPTDPGERAGRAVLDRPHATIANAAREALIKASSAAGTPVTKNEARARVAEALPPATAASTLLDLPRGALPSLIDALTDLTGR